MTKSTDDSVQQIRDQITKSVGSESDTLMSILMLLRKNHIDTIGMDRVGEFRDGLDDLTGRHANSLAESLRNLAREMSLSLQQAAEAPIKGESSTRVVAENDLQRVQSVELILSDLLLFWNEQGKDLRSQGYWKKHLS